MIPFFLVQAHGGKVLTIDDRSVQTDLAALAGTGGTEFAPTLLSAPVHGQGAGGYAKLRRLVQRVPHDGDVTVEVTPYRDGQESGNAITRTLGPEDSPIVTVPMSETGTEFQWRITLSDFNADCGLGEGELWVVPRRSIRG